MHVTIRINTQCKPCFTTLSHFQFEYSFETLSHFLVDSREILEGEREDPSVIFFLRQKRKIHYIHKPSRKIPCHGLINKNSGKRNKIYQILQLKQ